ncbi:MAG: hypothetical protein JSV88_19995 [Candidatus Aminicenantes bacterium]|nr:MAG: hypothetical protein JSV88_19995 [Candidatus Aminicenantes bacterium]
MDSNKIDIECLKRNPDYKGSVQDIYKVRYNNEPHLVCRASDAGSIFDVGTIFTIPRSGERRTTLRHYIYSLLRDPCTWRELTESDFSACYADENMVRFLLKNPVFEKIKSEGVPTHHVGIINSETGEIIHSVVSSIKSNLVLIKEFPVQKPRLFTLLRRPAWDYSEYYNHKKKIMALEHVFRLGNPGGSSIQQRYEKACESGGEKTGIDFLEYLGIKPPLLRWMTFDNMIYDCATKYEAFDRHLDWQETVHISGVSSTIFERTVLLLIYCTVMVNKFFKELGFALWDIKWEVAVDGDNVIVVDTIDQDSVRITGSTNEAGHLCFVHFNKQAVRDYYRFIHQNWYSALNECKRLSKSDSRGRTFMQIYMEGVKTGDYPEIPTMDPDYAEFQARKYDFTVAPIYDSLSPQNVEMRKAELIHAEIDFYKKAGKIEEFLAENSIVNI